VSAVLPYLRAELSGHVQRIHGHPDARECSGSTWRSGAARLQDQKITFSYIVPPIVLLLCKAPVVEKYDLSSIRMTE